MNNNQKLPKCSLCNNSTLFHFFLIFHYGAVFGRIAQRWGSIRLLLILVLFLAWAYLYHNSAFIVWGMSSVIFH